MLLLLLTKQPQKLTSQYLVFTSILYTHKIKEHKHKKTYSNFTLT